jgi:predicted glycoside hydrolase/deacetylase ChbG (UPF0249 family)
MTTPSRLLIVNADDYGLTTGVSRAILHAHRHGIVTSTSVLAVAPGFTSTVGCLREAPGLGTGAHLALVGEDPPLLTALEVPTLVDGQGRFPNSWRRLAQRLAARMVDPDDVRLELRAQIERLQQAGLRLTHVDTHQAVHLWPAIGRIVLDLAVEHGIPAVSVPRSTSWAPRGVGVRRMAARLARRAGRVGLVTTRAAAGIDHTGRLDGARLARTLGRLGSCRAASAELATHPGPVGDVDLDRYRWGFRWAEELDALVAPEARAAVERAGFRLGTYGDLAAPTPPSSEAWASWGASISHDAHVTVGAGSKGPVAPAPVPASVVAEVVSAAERIVFPSTLATAGLVADEPLVEAVPVVPVVPVAPVAPVASVAAAGEPTGSALAEVMGSGPGDHCFDAAANRHLPPHDPGDAGGGADDALVGALDAVLEDVLDDEALLEADAALAAATAGAAGATGVPLTGAVTPWPLDGIGGVGGLGQGAGPATHLSPAAAEPPSPSWMADVGRGATARAAAAGLNAFGEDEVGDDLCAGPRNPAGGDHWQGQDG